jgi:flagella basal body P-ring formation protein FlgA
MGIVPAGHLGRHPAMRLLALASALATGPRARRRGVARTGGGLWRAMAALALPAATWLVVVGFVLGARAAHADDDVAAPLFKIDDALLKQVASLARGGASQLAGDAGGATAPASAPATASAATPGVRVEVQVGKLDPRLRLAPCAKIEPYLPPGVPLWGASRVGLKCVQGAKAWNVSLPVTVHVYGRSVVAAANLAAGTVLEADMLGVAEVDLAAAPGAAIPRPELAVGRTLAHPLVAGGTLRQNDLKARQWFAAGETVRVVAGGSGWQVVTEAQAVSAGVEGQVVRVRTEAGRLLLARPIGEREVEVVL